MWEIHWHTLAYLTTIMFSKVHFKWTKIEQYVFNEINLTMVRDNLITYPDFKEEFKIHTNASTFQLWAVIIQKCKPISFYSRKLTDDQISCTVTERELLSIFETLNLFRTILLG